MTTTHYRHCFIVAILTLVNSVGIFSQSLPPGSGYNSFKTYSLEQGLPQSTVFCQIQDSRGYIWVGTQGAGVCRFDGQTFKSYSTKQGLAGNNVRCIIEDSKGRLWIGSDKGLTFYDGIRFRIINDKDGLSGSTVTSLMEDHKHNIWAGTDDGGVNKIYFARNDSLKILNVSVKEGLSSPFICDLYEDRKGRIWLATYAGGVDILSFDKKETTIEYMRQNYQIPSDLIYCIEPDKEGGLWFGTLDAGAFKLVNAYAENTGMIVQYNPTNGLNDVRIWDILCDKSGDIWFGTNENGAVRLHNNQFLSYDDKNGMPNNMVMSVFEDSEENIWLGTSGSGLVKFIGDHFSQFTEQNGLSGNNVFGIEEDSSGNIFLASQIGISILRFENNRFATRVLTSQDGLIDNFVKTIVKDSYGKMWAGTDNGISSFFPGDIFKGLKNFTHLTTKNGLLDNKSKIILFDSRNDIWVGGQYGVCELTGRQPFYLTEERGLSSNDIQAMIEDRQGNIWIGSMNGLSKYDYKLLKNYDEMEGLNYKSVNALTEDYRGNIWIGTDGGGLYRFNTHTADTVSIGFIADDNVLSSNIIYSMIFADTNILVTGTNKGFDKISLDGAQKISHIKRYDNSNGFFGVENNQNAIFKDSKGNIWLGTVKGVTRYSPSLEKPGLTPPLVHITDLKLFYKPVDWKTESDSVEPWFLLPKSLILPYSKNHVTFSYSGIALINPDRVLFQCRLEPTEKEWSPLRKEREITYSGLQPGEYTFSVIAINENDIRSSQPAIYSFTINPPWYRTWLFYFICVIVLIVSIWSFIKVRERRLKEEKRILEQLVAERTSEVVKQKEEIEEKNKTLTDANVEISKQKHIIEEKNKDITDSINYAKRIQQALLPRDEDVRLLLPDSFVLFRPKDIVSGDFYWINQKDDIAYFTASDCTGHGVPGAFVSMINMELLNEAINVKNILNPGRIFDEVRKGLIRSLKQTGAVGQQKDGMDSALCSLCPGNNGKTIFECAAGNNAVVIIRKSEAPLKILVRSTAIGEKEEELPFSISLDGNYLYEIKPDKQPIGISDSLKPFTNFTAELEKGDVIYLTTDGYEDQFGGPNGKKFMRKKLKELWLTLYDKPVAEQKEILSQKFDEYKGELDQVDDVCIFGVRV